MNLEQAKAKLNSVSNSTATKHPKVLVSELCAVVKFLLDEVERLGSSTPTIITRLLPEITTLPTKSKPVELPPSLMPPPENQPELPSLFPDVMPKKRREGNAGDAT